MMSVHDKEKEAKRPGLISASYINSGTVTQKKKEIELIDRVCGKDKFDFYNVIFKDNNWHKEQGKRTIKLFHEIRARRNLLVHRGENIDKNP